MSNAQILGLPSKTGISLYRLHIPPFTTPADLSQIVLDKQFIWYGTTGSRHDISATQPTPSFLDSCYLRKRTSKKALLLQHFDRCCPPRPDVSHSNCFSYLSSRMPSTIPYRRGEATLDGLSSWLLQKVAKGMLLVLWANLVSNYRCLEFLQRPFKPFICWNSMEPPMWWVQANGILVLDRVTCEFRSYWICQSRHWGTWCRQLRTRLGMAHPSRLCH